MVSNFISPVAQLSIPDAVGRIATALGVDHNKAQFAVSASLTAPWTAPNEATVQKDDDDAQRTANEAGRHTGSGNASNWRISLAGSVSE